MAFPVFLQIRKPGEAPRLQVSVGFTWDEDMNAMDIPVLNEKEESSESEEEEDPHSKVLCTSVVGQETPHGGCNVMSWYLHVSVP